MAGLISRFASNRKGNFGMMLAFAMPALMASVALGLDISNSLSTKTEMQDANDTAVLMAARYFKEYRKQPPMSLVQKFLDANATMNIKAQKLTFNTQRTEFTLESTTKVKTYLMGYFGQGNVNYDALSKANLGFAETLEFALALDTTFSMSSDGKMDGLKVAANDFLDAMFDAKDRGADIKGGIVPFAQYVNVGISQKGQSWLSVPKDIDTRVTTNVCRKETPITGQTNCRNVYNAGYTIDHPATVESCYTNDGVKTCTPASGAWTENVPASNSNVCDNTYGPEQTICENVTTGQLITWQGYVGSRDYPLNVQDGTYGRKIPGLLDVVGSVEIQRLTADRTLLKNKINSLTPSGETYMPEGVIWGTRVLTKQAPFTEAKTTGNGGRPVRRVLVLMTDGENTLSPNGIYHTNTDTAQADVYTAEACDEAKAKDLEVFTISFGTAVPASARDLLEACASSPDQFFHAKSSSDLKQAFDSIAAQMLNVRLSQ
jgi:Flp pilus assembly protein TadG